MSETLPQIRPSFNRSLNIETRCERLSADTGALAQREILERTGIIDWLTERLHDPLDMWVMENEILLSGISKKTKCV